MYEFIFLVCGPPVGNAHQVFSERCVVGHRDAATIVVPLNQWLDGLEIMCPNRIAILIMTAEEFVFRPVVHISNTRLDPKHVNLVPADPRQISEARFFVCHFGTVPNQISVTIRGVLHVLAEIDKMRRPDLDGIAVHARLTK